MSSHPTEITPLVVGLREAKTLLNMGEVTIRKKVKAGEIPVLPREKNGTLRFSVEALRQWVISSSKVEAA